MIKRYSNNMLRLAAIAGAVTMALSGSAFAYDGTKCKEAGNCWEAKPGYPEKVAGSEYDPQHDPMELNRQQESLKAMEARNRQRVEYFKRTGEFIYDVEEIPTAQ